MKYIIALIVVLLLCGCKPTPEPDNRVWNQQAATAFEDMTEKK